MRYLFVSNQPGCTCKDGGAGGQSSANRRTESEGEFIPPKQELGLLLRLGTDPRQQEQPVSTVV